MASYVREVYYSWLTSAGLAPALLKNLLEAGTTEAIWDAVMHGERTPCGVPLAPGPVSVLQDHGQSKYMDTWARLTEKHRIRACIQGDSEYPKRLYRIQDPPAILFYTGSVLPDEYRAAAVVGSRSASWKGLSATEKIAEALSRESVTIISGLAYGIDTAAHQGCLKGGSPTVAVMGCGLDRNYPAENSDLRQQILDQGGLLMSEYAPGEKPLGWHFPVRNRIISGLSDCVILMEARIRSGSMTTVQHALDQGLDVFVYPGEPDSLKSEANHQLLREGAIYFTTAEDILEDMRWLDKRQEVRQNSGSVSTGGKLSEAERTVMNCLERGPMTLDQLCEALHTDAGPMMAQLTMMQIAGLIEALPGKQYGVKEK